MCHRDTELLFEMITGRDLSEWGQKVFDAVDQAINFLFLFFNFF
jgi:hypothetical protein